MIRVVDGAVTSELRRSVLRPTWPPGTRMHGDDDPAAVHLAALTDDGVVVGACVLLQRPFAGRPQLPAAWQLRGMATAAEQRGQGIGTSLVEAAVVHVTGQGGRLIWCQARTAAVAFYTRTGFVPHGAEFVQAETGLAHQLMYRELFGHPGSSDQ